MVFLDTNILIDLFDPGSAWHLWSTENVHRAEGPRGINPVVLAELSPRFEALATLTGLIGGLGITVHPIDDHSAFHAGHAHAAYRAAGGERQAILADFLIGAHAQTLGATLLTRDRRRFVRYFPDLTLITPSDTDNG
ncbi:type II toxin-antitoxin system VapC family toxin [Sphingomonas naphthae]|uniref:Type II toxin-antitoxin system VapC family toxin n=1 Tax=Sphingomonas naphthae TaxID=1813468 RepID=A0ABY7TI56_9SPHN|nr:type II toxin-antitoxin system VapC family toxin [Sphingomonas naphthae]WCT72733.1 type II toxin-antitoxin system VapC family toxin [Sphingomonas naphthae]